MSATASTTRSDKRTLACGVHLWGFISLQRLWRKLTAYLLFPIKPHAIDDSLVPLRADGFDGHDGTAGSKLDFFTGRIGVLTHSPKSPAAESHKRKSVSRQDGRTITNAARIQDSTNPQFRLGDIARLNSGGPKMMVVDTDGESIVAAWRDDDGSALEGVFPAVCVRRVSPLG